MPQRGSTEIANGADTSGRAPALVGDRSDEVFALENRIAGLETELESNSRELADVRSELASTQRSLSWRLTAPLRVGKATLRRRRPPTPAQREAGQTDTTITAGDVWVPLLEVPAELPRSTVRTVAFYLPQFHPIPENDAWWGRGFTEWTYVARARPLFDGHVQPRLPGELGFYDLRLVETQRRQVELARLYGIDAFCFYAYWFEGRRILERPLEQYAADPDLDLPFCVCWANENWTRRWDGHHSQVLLEQRHSPADDLAFIEHHARYLVDPRYLQVGDRPLLVVYRPANMPDPQATTERWRAWFREAHGRELFLAFTESLESFDPQAMGFDAAIEFPPLRPQRGQPLRGAAPAGSDRADAPDARILDWRCLAEETPEGPPTYPVFRGVCPSWDNTPRRGKSATIFRHSSPAGFQNWLVRALGETEARLRGPERLVFVNAWNEWAEGCYLEPDARHGYAYLEAVRVASVRAGARPTETPAQLQLGAVVHAFHPELLRDIIDRLEALDPAPEVLVTTVAERRDAVERQFSDSDLRAEIVTVRNLGRDLWPFLQALQHCDERSWDLLLKLHTKRSHHRDNGGIWRDQLLDDLVAPEAEAAIRSAFEADPGLGMIGPTGHRLATTAFIGANVDRVGGLGQRLGFETIDDNRSFFAGTMFYVRTAALAPLRAIQLGESDFEPELGQIDGTLAHALERCVPLSVESAGYTVRGTHDLSGRETALPLRRGYAFARETRTDGS